MNILEKIRARAISKPPHILLPEGEDDRTILAASKIAAERIARVTVFGEEEKIRARASALGASLTNVSLFNHYKSADLERYAQEYYELRRAKGLSPDEARKELLDPLYFANMMVRAGKADGSVAGATNTRIQAGVVCCADGVPW
jgi:phosphotransacetylase